MAQNKGMSVSDIFKKYQFKDMMFDVFDMDAKMTVFKLYPEIDTWDSVVNYRNRKITVETEVDGKIVKRKIKAPILDLENILKYVFYVYDIRSPLIKQTRELSKRKEWGVALSNLKKVANTDRVADIISNNDPHVIEIAVEFLTRYQPVKWTMICSYEQQFKEFQSTLMKKTSDVKDDKDLVTAINAKSALLEKSDKIAERLTELYKEVFTEDLASVARVMSKTSPEKRAMMNLERFRKLNNV
jgi:hypothetical protein